MVEGSALEKRCPRKGAVSSNLTLSVLLQETLGSLDFSKICGSRDPAYHRCERSGGIPASPLI